MVVVHHIEEPQRALVSEYIEDTQIVRRSLPSAPNVMPRRKSRDRVTLHSSSQAFAILFFLHALFSQLKGTSDSRICTRSKYDIYSTMAPSQLRSVYHRYHSNRGAPPSSCHLVMDIYHWWAVSVFSIFCARRCIDGTCLSVSFSSPEIPERSTLRRPRTSARSVSPIKKQVERIR